MTRPIGYYLHEITDAQLQHKQYIVLGASLFAIALLVHLIISSLSLDLTFFAASFGFLASLHAINIGLLKSDVDIEYSILLLSSLSIMQSVLLTALESHQIGCIIWIAPFIALTILINKARRGLLFSVLTLIPASLIIELTHTVNEDTLFIQYFYVGSLSIVAISLAFSHLFERSFECISTLKSANIEELAYFDRLTGLANRWTFESWAKERIKLASSDSEHLTAIVFIDFDNFKMINDNYGHDNGDRVLSFYAQRLKNTLRLTNRQTGQNEPSIGRYAGDEFVCLLSDISDYAALDKVLHRICNIFETPSSDEKSLSNTVTASIGVAILFEHGDDLSELMRNADQAMYQAKALGKNQFCYYSKDNMSNSDDFMDMPAISLRNS